MNDTHFEMFKVRKRVRKKKKQEGGKEKMSEIVRGAVCECGR